MPKVNDIPNVLRPFVAHGLDLNYSAGGSQACGACPFCGSQGKHSTTFYVNQATGLWDCKSCGEKGNAITFVRKLWDESDKATRDYADLQKNRGLLYPDTLMAWGAARSVVDGAWLLPGFNGQRKLHQVYRYTQFGDGHRALIPTAGLHEDGKAHGFHMADFDPNKPIVDVLEGPWDGMAFWEAARVSKRASGSTGLSLTANPEVSLLAETNVVAVPGCNVFKEDWCPIFSRKRVRLWFDSDGPRKHPQTGKENGFQGFNGMKRVAQILAAASEPPESIEFVNWGEHGYDPDQKSGYDVRDAIVAGGDAASGRVAAIGRLLERVAPIPADWVAGRSRATVKGGGTNIEVKECRTWRQCHNAWRKAMDFIDGLDQSLVAILATVLSTDCPGDQIFLRVIGPPASGKSSLCEAASVNRRWVLPRDDVTMIVSGFQVDAAGSENQSLLFKMNHKTLIIKEADPLLKAANKEQILAQFRSLYDRAFRKQFGNKMTVDEDDLSTTVVIAGTSNLRNMDSSELGERFITIEVMKGINDDLERRIGTRVANRTYDMLKRGRAAASGHNDEAMLEAKQLTAGYIDHLRENADELLAGVEVSAETLDRLTDYGIFISHMRARPGSGKNDVAEREMSTRLISQFTRLAMCIAVVVNRTEVDAEVMRRVHKIAMDTAGGATLDLVQLLSRHRDAGCEARSLLVLTHHAETEIRRLLRFLKQINVVEAVPEEELKAQGITGASKRWRLTERFQALYEEVMPWKHNA